MKQSWSQAAAASSAPRWCRRWCRRQSRAFSMTFARRARLMAVEKDIEPSPATFAMRRRLKRRARHR